jgi:hypothetical protein
MPLATLSPARSAAAIGPTHAGAIAPPEWGDADDHRSGAGLEGSSEIHVGQPEVDAAGW